MTALVVEIETHSLRGVLFARVEGQIRFVAAAECQRDPSLSAAVETLAARLAGQSGMSAGQIQRDPVFVASSPDDLVIASIRVIERRQAIANCCAALALARGEAVGYVGSRVKEGDVTVVRADPGGRPEIETRQARTPDLHIAPEGDWETAVADARALWRVTSGDAGLIVAAEPFAATVPGSAALAMLDIVMPSPGGRIEVVRDLDNLTAAAGALDADALHSVAVLDLSQPSATAMVVDGSGEPGMLAARGRADVTGHWGTRFSVPWGSIHWVPSPSWLGGTVTIAGQGAATIAGGASTRHEQRQSVHAGLLIDARGPLRELRSRRDQAESWLSDAAGAISRDR